MWVATQPPDQHPVPHVLLEPMLVLLDLTVAHPVLLAIIHQALDPQVVVLVKKAPIPVHLEQPTAHFVTLEPSVTQQEAQVVLHVQLERINLNQDRHRASRVRIL